MTRHDLPDQAGPLLDRLLIFLDDGGSADERRQVEAILRQDPAARDLLRDLAEQAVTVADCRRMAGEENDTQTRQGERPRAGRQAWRWPAIAAGLVVAAAAAGAFSARPAAPLVIGQVTKAVGATRLFTAAGRIEEGIAAGATVGPGDTLESRSSDAWVATALSDGATLTIAGESVIRVLLPEASERRFDLVEGSLWLDPASGTAAAPVVVRTPAAVLEATGALFDVRSGATETVVRVHGGLVRAARRVDGAILDVLPGSRCTVTLAADTPLAAEPQPDPTADWQLDPVSIGAAGHGLLRLATADRPASLSAFPLLWREGSHAPVLLHVVGAAVWRASDAPVRIGPESRFRFRGRTTRPVAIRFGVSTQRMQGVFSGKFEVDVPPQRQARDADTFEVELTPADLVAVNPTLANSAEGLEVADIYALTILEDAGLELVSIEVTGEE
ncbi:MAG: FecR family protein [Planctomycetota bacterium]|nr:FecR family protein [Planctomycetota bacterium]